ncbi:MAG TPA: cytochrome b/b6 domain-containing protein [Thermohalobaculum sp.]|nr:cytochrome b/b6 domain-containing protein [Thermohalobaculum sp.]
MPTRLFHWGLVLALAAAWTFVWMNEMTWHMYAGYSAATLVVFRLIWGLIGSDTARFSQFVRGPATLMNYLRTGVHDRAGHNPLGALSVLALLVFVLTQAGTGLFSNDDIFFDGPWARVVTKDTSDAVTSYHKLNKNILLALIALHLGAVAWYHWRGRNLTRPMLTGRAEAPAELAEPRRRPLWLAALALALAAGLVGVAFRFWWL